MYVYLPKYNMTNVVFETLDREQSSSLLEKSSAGRILFPLMDALNWQGNDRKIHEAMIEDFNSMTTEDLIETMANLRFKYYKVDGFRGEKLDITMLPAVLVDGEKHILILRLDEKKALVFQGESGSYKEVEAKDLRGELYFFQYADDVDDSLLHPQKNWFNKLIHRFSHSFKSIALLSFLITCLDLVIPLLIILIYDQISSQQTVSSLMITFVGVLIYIAASYTFGFMRSQVLNYISTRMGAVISTQTLTRLLHLSPSYTETASINAQINRIKDFENLKTFITSGVFVDLLELIFASIYVIAIFVLGGWLGFVPIVTLLIIIGIGIVMRPYHKIRLEKVSEWSAKKQQSLIEILNNADDIKVSGLSETWLSRYEKIASESIIKRYELSDYVNTSKSVSYFITNASVLVVVYGGVIKIFNGDMSTGTLIGILLLYWKVLSSVRGAFNLSVQVNGLMKSIKQINKFMNLPQDSQLKTDMMSTKDIKGRVKFTDVSIRYSKKAAGALLKINFTQLPGQIMGITGHDGAGKTTILKLILGMYQPQAGRIMIDGVNIKQLEPLSLRHSMSYAPQKDMIFTGTIRENFKIYQPQITDEQIMTFASKTGLESDFKTFGYDLDTNLTEDTIQDLSLSFKKLLNLTRMLLRDVKLYLVDEPENYLDKAQLERVINLLKDLAKEEGVSVIISTKAPQVLDICDQVIRLDQGKMRKKKTG